MSDRETPSNNEFKPFVLKKEPNSDSRVVVSLSPVGEVEICSFTVKIAHSLFLEIEKEDISEEDIVKKILAATVRHKENQNCLSDAEINSFSREDLEKFASIFLERCFQKKSEGIKTKTINGPIKNLSKYIKLEKEALKNIRSFFSPSFSAHLSSLNAASSLLGTGELAAKRIGINSFSVDMGENFWLSASIPKLGELPEYSKLNCSSIEDLKRFEADSPSRRIGELAAKGVGINIRSEDMKKTLGFSAFISKFAEFPEYSKLNCSSIEGLKKFEADSPSHRISELAAKGISINIRPEDMKKALGFSAFISKFAEFPEYSKLNCSSIEGLKRFEADSPSRRIGELAANDIGIKALSEGMKKNLLLGASISKLGELPEHLRKDIYSTGRILKNNEGLFSKNVLDAFSYANSLEESLKQQNLEITKIVSDLNKSASFSAITLGHERILKDYWKKSFIGASIANSKIGDSFNSINEYKKRLDEKNKENEEILQKILKNEGDGKSDSTKNHYIFTENASQNMHEIILELNKINPNTVFQKQAEILNRILSVLVNSASKTADATTASNVAMRQLIAEAELKRVEDSKAARENSEIAKKSAIITKYSALLAFFAFLITSFLSAWGIWISYQSLEYTKKSHELAIENRNKTNNPRNETIKNGTDGPSISLLPKTKGTENKNP